MANRVLDRFDCEAIIEAGAIGQHKNLTIKPTGRDDNKIRSKNYFLRESGPSARYSRTQIKYGGRRSKQIDLKSIDVHMRLAIAVQKEKLKKLQKRLDKQS